jgi:CRP-like cAMP-binding protein
MVALAGRRLAELQERVREVSTQQAPSRIANALLRLAQKSDRRTDGGAIEIAIPLVRRDIAALSGTTLHTASRVMASWDRQGIIVSAGRCISVNSMDELARIGGASQWAPA